MGTCRAKTTLGLCPDEATVKVRGGCRHEHIKYRMLCQWHAADLMRPDSRAVCAECADAGHDCKVLAEVLP